MEEVAELLGILGTIGFLVVVALALIGWRAGGWKGIHKWDAYQDGIAEVRKWLGARQARRIR